MWQNLPLLPEQASTIASRVDALFLFVLAVVVLFGTLIFVLIVYFAVKYRRRAGQGTPKLIAGNLVLELLWTVIPLALTMVMFFWGAFVYVEITNPPADAIEIIAVGKQWMWKLQHPDGHQEINELHVPVGRPVKLTMTSEDVIHSFFVPAFRIKMDVLPGRYSNAWFEATRPGRYRLFCAEFCGTQHSGMIGSVIVLELSEYEGWLSGRAAGISTAKLGEGLFQRLGCVSCHRPDGAVAAPSLVGLFGRHVKLADGRSVVADEDYIRESIIDPRAKVVAGYQPVMPTYRGLISEDGILQIIAYLKSTEQATGQAARP
jgi:cytochrome c oxidase subunit II